MKLYTVAYTLNGHEESGKFEGINPGHAFARCMKEVPGAMPIKCSIMGKIAGAYLWIDYDMPKIVEHPAPPPAPKMAQVEFGFV